MTDLYKAVVRRSRARRKHVLGWHIYSSSSGHLLLMPLLNRSTFAASAASITAILCVVRPTASTYIFPRAGLHKSISSLGQPAKGLKRT